MMRLLFCLILWVSSLLATTYPELTSSDVRDILNQMLEAHATYKKLSPELVARALEQFAEELDPTKTYLLQEELAPWLHPSPTALETMADQIEKGDYTPFYQIHACMVTAIDRRSRLERWCERRPFTDPVDPKSFTNLTWSQDEEALTQRLLHLHALQNEAAARLEKTAREKVLARISKRRLLKETEIKGNNGAQKERFLLCFILKAFAAAFDTHTCYFTPAEAAQFLIQVQQRLFGIGAQLRDDLNGFTIVKIIEGGPASRDTGLKNGDRIIAINSEPVVGLDLTDAVELIRGEEGSQVVLTVLREVNDQQEMLDISITRGEVVIKESRIEASTIPFADGVIAFIALHAFYQDPMHSSGADLYEEIVKIRKEHKVKGMIIDLRNNSGGVLPQAITVTGLFITKGIIASVKDNLGNIEHLREIDGKMAYDGPLIILTSKASASAAEILAQTLQDYGRAIIVGDDYTYGKGTFQTFTLDAATSPKINPKGELKITRGRYYTVSGKSPQLVGVKPDIVVPGLLAYADIGEQHSKYPLANDAIAENFQDDLSDIPAIQREQISWLYRFNLQSQLKMYTRFLPILQENSRKRLESDLLYQQFLTMLKEEDFDDKALEFYLKSDLQLKETVNIMKDLILLLN